MVCLLSGYELPWAAQSRELFGLMAPVPFTQRCLLIHCLLWKPQWGHRPCSQADLVCFWSLHCWLTLETWLPLWDSIPSNGTNVISFSRVLGGLGWLSVKYWPPSLAHNTYWLYSTGGLPCTRYCALNFTRDLHLIFTTAPLDNWENWSAMSCDTCTKSNGSYCCASTQGLASSLKERAKVETRTGPSYSKMLPVHLTFLLCQFWVRSKVDCQNCFCNYRLSTKLNYWLNYGMVGTSKLSRNI